MFRENVDEPIMSDALFFYIDIHKCRSRQGCDILMVLFTSSISFDAIIGPRLDVRKEYTHFNLNIHTTDVYHTHPWFTPSISVSVNTNTKNQMGFGMIQNRQWWRSVRTQLKVSLPSIAKPQVRIFVTAWHLSYFMAAFDTEFKATKINFF